MPREDEGEGTGNRRHGRRRDDLPQQDEEGGERMLFFCMENVNQR